MVTQLLRRHGRAHLDEGKTVLRSNDGVAVREAPSSRTWKRTLEPIAVWLRGLAQLVFSDRSIAGLLLLGAIWLVSPWSALGALLGAAFATAVGGVLSVHTRGEWRAGLSGFNGAIIGILWGGFFASGNPQLGLFVVVLSVCVFFETALRSMLQRSSLPPLSMPAVITAMLVSLIFAPIGTWFWIDATQSPFGTPGTYAAIVCVVLAAGIKHQGATLQALVLAAAALWVANTALGLAPLDSTGLWAFAVAPASFAAQAIFVPGILVGAAAGLVAACLAAGIWTAWVLTGFADVTQPLLAPFILGTWFTLVVIRRQNRAAWLEPTFWRGCLAWGRAYLTGRVVVALTGGGITEDIGIPDYSAGTWRDPQLPASAYSSDRFASSLRCRRACWEAYEGLRDRVRSSQPSDAHRKLADLCRRGYVTATVTTSVDGLHVRAGSRDTIELYGCLDGVTCLDCGSEQSWPPGHIWQRWDLHCQACGGLLKPSVTFPAEAPEAKAWLRAKALVRGCSVLLVIGCPRQAPADEQLIDLARRHGARIVFVNQGPVGHMLHSGDLVIAGRIAPVLRAFAVALGALRPLAGAKEKAWNGTPTREDELRRPETTDRLRGS